MTRRIPLPLADEMHVLFGIPAATAAVMVCGLLAEALLYVHGGHDRPYEMVIAGIAAAGLVAPLEGSPVYGWLVLFLRFALAPRRYVCSPPASGPPTDRRCRFQNLVTPMKDEVTFHAHPHAPTVPDPGHRR